MGRAITPKPQWIGFVIRNKKILDSLIDDPCKELKPEYNFLINLARTQIDIGLSRDALRFEFWKVISLTYKRLYK